MGGETFAEATPEENAVTDVRVNAWSKLKFIDPAIVLPGLQELRRIAATSNLGARVKSLRTQKLKPHREGWQAAVFCFGMSQSLGVPVFFARSEASDYDAVCRWCVDGHENYAPLQMKEFVPANVNPEASLGGLLATLRKYPDSADLIVAVHLNRTATIDFSKLSVPSLPVREVWLFGSTTPDQGEWFLFGDVLSRPKLTSYSLRRLPGKHTEHD